MIVERTEGTQKIQKPLSAIPQSQAKGIFDWLLAAIGKGKTAKIGVELVPQIDTTVIAKFELENDQEDSEEILPRGAKLLAVGNKTVANWDQIAGALIENTGQKIEIAYLTTDQKQGTTSVELPEGEDWLGMMYRPDLGALFDIPLEPMVRQFRGETIAEDLKMGADMTWTFIAQTYMFIKGMITKKMKPSNAAGPVGILKMSYSIVQQKSITYYCYFMALISVCIAVFNFLPLPILDGGLIVLLLVEKIKGSPVSIKVQEILTYAGLIMLGGFVLFITYHDILRIAQGRM